MKHTLESTESVCVAVVEAVSAAEDRTARDLPPLALTIDGDSLEALFGGGTQTGAPMRRLSFQYSDSVVEIETNGEITVTQALPAD